MKIVVFIISFFLLINSIISVSANDEEKLCQDTIKTIAPYIDKNETITRGDCITAIMRLVGVDECTANFYSDMDFDQPVFADLDSMDDNTGYIILAKFSDIALGTTPTEKNGVNNFEPNRAVTGKECLAFMLRCLIDSEYVSWDSIIETSIKSGLLDETEKDFFVFERPLQCEQVYTLLYRMLNKKRHLYWPTDEQMIGYEKCMQIDMTNCIKYIDCFR